LPIQNTVNILISLVSARTHVFFFSVDMVELDSLYERFKMLDARDQDCLRKEDFQRTLAPIIAFKDNKNLSNSDAVFEMFDSNQDGVLTFQASHYDTIIKYISIICS